MQFTRDHEWLRLEADGSTTVGITHYAQEQLGDIVYVELPAVGSHVAAGSNCVVIESVKAVGEIKLPVGGTVLVVNTRIGDTPELVNTAPEGDGWLLRIRPDEGQDLPPLLDATAYAAYVDDLQRF